MSNSVRRTERGRRASGERLRECLRRHPRRIAYLLAFGIPFLACLLICMVNGAYPFGEECMLHVDMYHQYCPFFTEFLDKIRSGGSLLYSWSNGVGSDFVSLYAYYLASPLNWFIVLCPRGLVIEFMTLLVLLKIGFCGMCFYAFVEYRNGSGYPAFTRRTRERITVNRLEKRQVYYAVTAASAYALSGFVAAYSWDIMWMDCVALMPLVALGLLRMIREKKPTLYYVALAVCILSNYYLAIMICIFLCLYFVLLMVEEKETGLRDLGRFVLYSLLAGGTAAFLLIPEFKILGYSGSSGISWPEFKWYFNILAELTRVSTTAESYTGNSHWPNLYAGAFSLMLVVLYALNRQISWKKKLPRLLMLALFIVSFSNTWLDFIWHGLHFPDSLPGREAFLYAFVILVIGYEVTEHLRGLSLWHPIAAIIVWAAVLMAGYERVETAVTDTMSIFITGVLVLCYGLLAVMMHIGQEKELPGLRRLACGLAVGELIFNMASTGFSMTSRHDYLLRMEDYRTLIAQTEELSSGEFYRLEDTGRKTKNDSALYNYRSATQFSSLMNINVSHFYQNLYMEGGKNFYCYNGATPVPSAMLSVKYMLSDSDMEEGLLMHLIGQENGRYLYENTYCLPLGFVVPREAAQNWPDGSDRIDNLNLLGELLGATGNTITEMPVTTQENAGSTTFDVSQDGYYYAASNGCNSDSLTVTTSSGYTKKYSKTTHKYLIGLGYLNAGDTVTISNTNSEEISFSVYLLNTDAVDAAYETLAEQTMELTKLSDRTVEGTIDVKKAGCLFFSIPSEEGWSLWVDGERTDIEDFADTFISVSLEEGEHEIRLHYLTPGLLPGLGISVFCVLVFVGTEILRRKRVFQKK